MSPIADVGPRWVPLVRSDLVDDAHQVEPHNVRVPRFRWERFGTRVDAMPGVSRTGVLNQFIAWYNREPNAHLPQRPGKD